MFGGEVARGPVRPRRFSSGCSCTSTAPKVILLIGGYDKGGDPSERRQQREIREARRLLMQFQERQKRERARTRKGRG